MGQPGPTAANVFAATPWLRSGDGAEIQNDLRDLNVCSSCHAPIPVGATRCPRCQKFAKDNPGKRPRKSDIEKILAALIVEYQPADTVAKEAWRALAGAFAELRAARVGSLEWQRTISAARELSAQLEASRSVAREQNDLADLSTAQLIERTTDVLRSLLAQHDTEVQAQARRVDPAGAAGPRAEAAGPDAPPAPAPEPFCEYCHRICVGPEHHAFSVLHWSDPTEVTKRNEHATQVMFATMRHGSGITRW